MKTEILKIKGDWEENLVETGGYIWDTEWIETAYCPNCGAKMI